MRVDERIELRWENMLAGIRQQAEWLRHGPGELLGRARAVLAGPAPSRVYVSGCGDSHCAGFAARQAFEAWSGIPMQASQALELSRYELQFARAGAWAICISNAGKVVRTVEAATEARRRGLLTIGVTYAPESRLAHAADTTLAYRYHDPGFGPGTISYLASLTAVYVLALRAGELSGRLAPAEVGERLAVLEAQAETSARTLELAAAPAERLGRETDLTTKIDVVGGGPSFGTASFGRIGKAVSSLWR